MTSKLYSLTIIRLISLAYFYLAEYFKYKLLEFRNYTSHQSIKDSIKPS